MEFGAESDSALGETLDRQMDRAMRLARSAADAVRGRTDVIVMVGAAAAGAALPAMYLRHLRLLRRTAAVRERLRAKGVAELPADRFRSNLNVDRMKELGSGEHSPVYRCWFDHGDHEVKCTVKATGSRAAAVLDDFEREVATLRAAQGHPGVIELLGTHWDSRELGYVLVYEFAEGDTLKNLTRHQPTEVHDGEADPTPEPRADEQLVLPGMTLAVQFSVLKQVVDVMAYLHANSIMYRDLKSLNLIVSNSHDPDRVTVKLIDFGSACMFSQPAHSPDGAETDGGKVVVPLPRTKSSRSVKFPQLRRRLNAYFRELNRDAMLATGLETASRTNEVGTYDWMAPEVWEKQGMYTEKCDVYSFAMVLYEIVAWRDPWAGTDGEMYKHTLPSLLAKNLRPDMPDRVAHHFGTLITRCWATDPDARPSFAELRRELDEMERVFARFDADGGGTVSFAELQRAWCWERVQDHQLQALFEEADADGSGELDPGEFATLMSRVQSLERSLAAEAGGLPPDVPPEAYVPPDVPPDIRELRKSPGSHQRYLVRLERDHQHPRSNRPRTLGQVFLDPGAPSAASARASAA